jgi:L-arabinose isomerase
VRIGVFAIGLAAYWPQYPGLREGIEANLARVRERVSQWAEVIDGGMVDSAQAGAALGDRFAAERVDLTFCFVGTYATSTQVMPVAQRSRVPMVLLNLQPVATIDYATADTAVMLANVGLCAVPEIAGVLVRSGMPHGLITGHLEDDAIWPDLHGWVKAARAAKEVRTGRFGMLGHTYPGMLDMSTDVERVSASLGTHIEILEIDDLQDRVIAITANEISDRLQALRREFELVGEIGDEAMTFSAQVAVALERLVADFTLDGLAYFYRGTGGDLNERIAASMIVGNTQLTARGIPAAGEGDLKTAIAMKILHELGGGGSFCEFYAMDFGENLFVMGHDGPCHPHVAEGTVRLKHLAIFHGKEGGGLSVEMRAALGPVTMLGLTQTADGRLKLLVAEGESLPGPVFRIGNSSHRLRFGDDLAGFLESWCALGPTHHVALGLGHMARDVKRVATLLGLEVAQV